MIALKNTIKSIVEKQLNTKVKSVRECGKGASGSVYKLKITNAPFVLAIKSSKFHENLIKEKNMLKETDEAKIFDNLAYVMAELNIIHPFREGNGRSIREFIRLMAKRMGYDLNWGNADKEQLLEASILSVDNYKVLIGILEDCVE